MDLQVVFFGCFIFIVSWLLKQSTFDLSDFLISDERMVKFHYLPKCIRTKKPWNKTAISFLFLGQIEVEI